MPTKVTDGYATVQARIPTALLNRLHAYGRQHRFNVSELIREGLEMRLEAGVPGRSPWTQPPDNPEEPIAPEVLHVLQEMISATVRDALREQKNALPVSLPSDGQGLHAITPVLPDDADRVVHVLHNESPKGTCKGHVLQSPRSSEVLGYDPAIFYVGKLCKRGHDWQDTGQTLRRTANNNCVACNEEQQRKRRAQARGATV